MAEVYDGGSRTDASRIGGVGLQIIRDWVLRFNARNGLVDGKSPGAPSKLNADHRRALAEVVEAGPVPAVDGVVRWRRKDLARWLLETFAISLTRPRSGRMTTLPPRFQALMTDLNLTTDPAMRTEILGAASEAQ